MRDNLTHQYQTQENRGKGLEINVLLLLFKELYGTRLKLGFEANLSPNFVFAKGYGICIGKFQNS